MNITKQQILSAEGKELERLLGEVFNKPTRCINCDNVQVPAMGTLSCPSAVSVNNPRGWVKDDHLCLDVKAIPIHLTWDNAMKFSELAIQKHGLITFLKVLGLMGLSHILDVVILTIEQRLKAAALCKIGAE
jgi:hypothetical protein